MKKNEECWAVYGVQLGNYFFGYESYLGEGEPAFVSFDYNKVMKNIAWLVGFRHTHPNWSSTPSSVDDKSMNGWSNVTGRPINCIITGIDGTFNYLYENGNRKESKVVPAIYRLGSFVFGKSLYA